MSKDLQIYPLGKNVHIKVDEVSAGALNTSSRDSAIEYGEVISVGDEVKGLKKGDKVFFKAWGADLITYKDIKYCFINTDTGAILATVK